MRKIFLVHGGEGSHVCLCAGAIQALIDDIANTQWYGILCEDGGVRNVVATSTVSVVTEENLGWEVGSEAKTRGMIYRSCSCRGSVDKGG